MRKPACFFVLAIVGQILTRAQAPQTPPQQSTQVPGPFRSTISMVPLDVRVLDRNGKPISDLRQEDFTGTRGQRAPADSLLLEPGAAGGGPSAG